MPQLQVPFDSSEDSTASKPGVSVVKGILWKEIATQKWRYALYLAIIGLSGFVNVLPPKLYAFFTENATQLQSISEVSAYDFLQQVVFFGAILAAVMFVSNFFTVVCEEWVCLRIEANLRTRFMRYTQKLAFEVFDRAQRGDWLTKMSKDLMTVERFITIQFPRQMHDIVILLFVGLTFISQNGWLAVILLGSSAVIAVFNLFIQQRINPILDQLRDMHGQVFQSMLENFEGTRSIRSFKAEKFILGQFNVRIQSIIQKGLRVVGWVGLMTGSNALAVEILTAGSLAVIGWMIRGKSLAVHEVFTYPFYISLFYNSVFALVRAVFDWNDFFIHGRRLLTLMTPAFLSADEDDEAQTSGTRQEDGTDIAWPKCPESLHLSGVVLAYDGYAPLTKPFNFGLRHGEVVLLKGPSGCGKSTFMEILAGLRRVAAKAVTVREGGRDLSFPLLPGQDKIILPVDWTTFVEQRPFLFEGTLRENLIFGTDAVSDAQLWDVLQRANLSEFVHQSGGLGLTINDNGGNLSEGQKQRIGIARALLLDRPFLILDEPFAALDHDSVARLCRTISALRSSHGILIVSHTYPDGFQCDRELDFESWVIEKQPIPTSVVSAVEEQVVVGSTRRPPFPDSVVPV